MTIEPEEVKDSVKDTFDLLSRAIYQDDWTNDFKEKLRKARALLFEADNLLS